MVNLIRTSKIGFFAATILSIVLLIGAFFLNETEPYEVTPYPPSQQLLRTNSSDAKAELVDKKTCAGTGRSPRAIPASELILPVGRMAIQRKFSDLSRDAELGDEISAITLFFLATSCAPFRDFLEIDDVIADNSLAIKKDVCPSIPATIVNDPLSVLEALANNGSVRAQILYAKNAPIVAKYETLLDPSIANKSRSDMLRNAERFALSAARSGAVPAYSILAESYSAGIFGRQDRARAYSYGLTLNQLDPSPEAKAKLENIYKSLTRYELSQAVKSSTACSNSDSISFGDLRDFL